MINQRNIQKEFYPEFTSLRTKNYFIKDKAERTFRTILIKLPQVIRFLFKKRHLISAALFHMPNILFLRLNFHARFIFQTIAEYIYIQTTLELFLSFRELRRYNFIISRIFEYWRNCTTFSVQFQFTQFSDLIQAQDSLADIKWWNYISLHFVEKVWSSKKLV